MLTGLCAVAIGVLGRRGCGSRMKPGRYGRRAVMASGCRPAATGWLPKAASILERVNQAGARGESSWKAFCCGMSRR